MFKSIGFFLTIFIASLFFSTKVQADINTALLNICNIVIANDTPDLIKKIKQVQAGYRLKLKHYYSGISCAGNSLIRTALLNNANHTGAFLIKKLPKVYLRSPEPDGKTLQQWIEYKNMHNSPIATALKNRI